MILSVRPLPARQGLAEQVHEEVHTVVPNPGGAVRESILARCIDCLLIHKVHRSMICPQIHDLFLTCCMECRRGLAMRKLFVHLSVRLSNVWIMTKWKKDLSRFFNRTKDHLA